MEQENNSSIPWIILAIVLAAISLTLGILLYTSKGITKQTLLDKENLERKIQAAEDSISKLNALNTVYDNRIVEFRDSLTALSKVKNKTIIKYRDQKNFVSDASMAQLDSIIRANIGAKQ